ncbi:LLM class F420-dependent oxidoreductase [Amycolatopsis sp.]|uniref:LLM class F420-dependent oxidoreductase n=1 Tax=Amycolatopsis sp. TaxID=37632 RepID=UPI002E00FFA1|nr:LLM class F420-dependent oxidoreductase [Amycolatopsis sp.]
MRLSVSLGMWQDRPPEEVLATAWAADAAGYPELWIGEMATWDAFALATAIGGITDQISLTLGPLAVNVRDPAMIAMGVASVATLTGRETGVALGTSSDVVVRDWHGRSSDGAATALGESAQAVRELLAGKKAQLEGKVLRAKGYRLRLASPNPPLTIAAFGSKAIEVAARHADRMVLNLVSPATAATLVRRLHAAADRLGTTPPRVAAWVVGALNPGPEAVEQLRRGVVGYLAAPGYSDMFRAEGFGSLVDFALTSPHPRELLAAIGIDVLEAVGLVGPEEQLWARVSAYADAGVDELVIVPSATDADPAGAATLTTCRSLG